MSSVVVVDNEPDLRLLCRLVLEEVGHAVREADTAETALALLAEDVPDYLILDIRMEGIGGWEILSRVRGNARLDHIRVIVCSAHATAADARRAADEGALFLAKPFLPAELRGLIAPALAADGAGYGPAGSAAVG